jgi:hypothetical protein
VEPDERLGEEGNNAEGFSPPILRGRLIYLRPLSSEDYGFVRAMELDGDLSVRWRFRGAVVGPEQWAQSAWASTLAQFVVLRYTDPKPIGLVMAYRANFQDGHAFVAAESFETAKRSPFLIFGMALFIEYVFSCWPFHKLYLESAEFNVAQFGSGIGRFLEEEGRLREHLWYGGRRWDQVILALYRETWAREGRRVLGAVRQP